MRPAAKPPRAVAVTAMLVLKVGGMVWATSGEMEPV